MANGGPWGGGNRGGGGMGGGNGGGDDDRRTGNVRFGRDGLGGAGPELICQLGPGTCVPAADIHVDWPL